MAASSVGASRPLHPQPPHDKRSSSFRLIRADAASFPWGRGRGDLAECPEPEGSNAPKVARQIETPRPPDPIMRRPCADREEKRVTHGNGSRREKQLDPNNPNQRDTQTGASSAAAHSSCCRGAASFNPHSNGVNLPRRITDGRPRRCPAPGQLSVKETFSTQLDFPRG